MVDVHNYCRRLESSILKIKNSEVISNNNKDAILRFVDDCLANGITKGRVVRCMADLVNANRILGMDFDKAKIEDIKKTMAGI